MTDTPDAVKVLDRLIVAAKLLYANAEGCAVNHHGEDFRLHGLPGWLADCASDIAAAQSLDARAMQAAMAGREVRVKALAEFARHRIEETWSGCEDAELIQAHALSLGLLVDVPGGFDPEKHDDGDSGAKPGAPWYVFPDWLKRASIEPAGAQEGADEIERLARRLAEISPDTGVLFEAPDYEVRLKWLTDPTPEAGDLKEQLRRGTGIRDSVLYTEADAHAADCTMKEAASRIAALEAEVDSWRKATWEAREGIVQRDERLPLLMNGWTARAAAAEAERDALRAEVERGAWPSVCLGYVNIYGPDDERLGSSEIYATEQEAREHRDTSARDYMCPVMIIPIPEMSTPLDAIKAQARREALEMVKAIAQEAYDECEKAVGPCSETGAYECDLERSGRDCLCMHGFSVAEALAERLEVVAGKPGEAEGARVLVSGQCNGVMENGVLVVRTSDGSAVPPGCVKADPSDIPSSRADIWRSPAPAPEQEQTEEASAEDREMQIIRAIAENLPSPYALDIPYRTTTDDDDVFDFNEADEDSRDQWRACARAVLAALAKGDGG